MQLSLHKHLTNEELSLVFQFIADVLTVTGSNPFRIRAYENAAAAIESYPKQLYEIFLSDSDFDQVPGVGETISQKLTELFTTGNIKAFQKYVERIPAGMLPLTLVQGIGAKKAYKLATTFGLNTAATALDETLKLAQAGKIRELPGFGEKSEKDIIEQIMGHEDTTSRIPWDEAHRVAQELLRELRLSPDIERAEALGSLRRHTRTVGDIDLGIAVRNIGSVKNYVKSMKRVKRVVVAGDQLIRVILTNNHQVDIKVSTPEEWGAFLQHFTGSKEHNIKLREYALTRGQSLSEHGIKVSDPDTNTTVLQTFSDETDFYHALGLEFIPPSRRVGSTEIADFQLK